MPENKILNKSLNDLLNDSNLSNKVSLLEKSSNSLLLDISLIKPNPYQPRKFFEDSALKELSESIKEYGVFTPIIVRRKDDYYEIVAGERRYRASLLAKKTSIPAIIENFTDQEMSEIALIENIQREDLSPLEISKALYDYQQQFSLTQQELADKFNKSRSYVANILRLRQLPKQIQEELDKGNISVGHVRTLIGLKEEEALEYFKAMKDKNMNVREAENLISSIKYKKEIKKKEDNEKSLKEKLKTNVKITKNEIKISFNNQEELEKLLREIVGKNSN